MTDAEAINETARWWLKNYEAARAESGGVLYAGAIAKYTAQLLCPHTTLKRVNDSVWCDTCQGRSTGHTPINV